MKINWLKRKNIKPKEADIEPNNVDKESVVLWILASQILCLLPLFGLVPFWIILICIGVGIWRWLAVKNHYPLPNRFVTFVVGLLAALAIVQTYGTLISREAGVSLIVLMFSLKLLEMRHFRDAILILFLSYFLLVVNFLYYENVFIVIYLFFTVFVITMSLIILNSRNESIPYPDLAKLTGMMIGLALPLSLVLFLFFPRLSSPLWQIPGDNTASTGFSDNMSPGSISELFESDEIAFRVKFHSRPADITQLYWRGLVLTDYDGLVWRESSAKSVIEPFFTPKSDGITYTVALEPHGKKWLFGAELSLPKSEKVDTFDDFSMSAEFNINSMYSYSLTYYDDYEFEPKMLPLQKSTNLSLPEGFNENTRNWAIQQRETVNSDREFLALVRSHIRNREYYYTLRPPVYERNIVDDFWFSGRQGYCEHYASALVYVMRAAKIPARVVIGYSGGDYNPYGDYLILRAKDAHAWTEVWFPETGWERVDPTAWIHPSRVQRDLADAIERRSSSDPGGEEAFLNQYVRKLSNTELISFMMDSIQHAWNEWYLGYDKMKQLSLFKDLGFDLKSTLVLFQWMVVIMLVLVVGLGVVLIRLPKTGDQLNRAFRRMEKRLAKRKPELARAKQEAPIAYLQRLEKELPQQKAQLIKIKRAYSQLRYREAPEENNPRVSRLIKNISALKIVEKKNKATAKKVTEKA